MKVLHRVLVLVGVLHLWQGLDARAEEAPKSAEAAEVSKVHSKVCIAHRGASAYAPEHTAAAYKKAMEMGADFVEPDLGMTKDGALVCIHDLTLERTTNVAQVYPDRTVQKDPTGRSRKSWRVADFTLAEIKKLDAGTWFDPLFSSERILTFQEMIDLVKTKPGTGIYPELKDPEYHASLGFHMEEAVLKVLNANGLDTPEGREKMPVILQSFNPDCLKKVRKLAGKNYKLIQLIDLSQARQLLNEIGLVQVARYADGVGPAIPLVIADPTRVVEAHKLGLAVHPYTVDSGKVPTLYPDALAYTHYLLYKLGADGVFTNNPDLFPRK